MSKIEWTDVTWSPVRGCSRVSKGCEHCYAERMAARFSARVGDGNISGPGVFDGFAKMTPAGPRWTGRVELIPEKLDEPLHWRKPRRVFVNSMSDLFHEALPASAIDRIFAVMADARDHTFQVLTKRPRRMLAYLSGGPQPAIGGWLKGNHRQYVPDQAYNEWPLPNVWLGVSVEDQRTADERIPLLLQTPAAVRFVSLEPLLEEVDVRPFVRRTWQRIDPTYDEVDLSKPKPRLDQVIVGGESGPHARPCNIAWIRSVRDQCREAGVPCFVKQLGARLICEMGPNLRYTNIGPLILPIRLKSPKGGDPAEWPEDLRVREFPR